MLLTLVFLYFLADMLILLVYINDQGNWWGLQNFSSYQNYNEKSLIMQIY